MITITIADSNVMPKVDVAPENLESISEKEIFSEEDSENVPGEENAVPEQTSIFEELSKNIYVAATFFVELFRELDFKEENTPAIRWTENWCKMCMDRLCDTCELQAEDIFDLTVRWLKSSAYEDAAMRSALVQLKPED